MSRRLKLYCYALAWIAVSIVATLLIANLSLGNKEIDKPLQRLFSVDSPHFQWIMGAALTPALVGGNQVQALVNGSEIFPSMLDAIRSAQTSITLETYIYWSGSVGREFTDALVERSKHGVRIKVLLDWFGSQLDEKLLEQMRAGGIDIQRYNPPAWHNLQRMNHRTHRRLMVVDGRVGFIGGAGLGDKWSGDAQDPEHWRDSHFRVEGPVVTQLQSAFIDNWIATTGEVLHSLDYLPRVADSGTSSAQLFTASPGGGSKSMQLMYLMAITSAATSIDLSAAYFIPDEVALQSLVAALERGVRVRIILPGPHMDSFLVRHASRASWGELLAHGAEIHEYQPTMFHCKVMVVDGLWVSVGSTNFDSRSFSINDEANLNVHDAAFAEAVTAIFEDDLRKSRRISLEEWQGRSWWTRALDAAATLLESQL
jgi:cardiolipin synthase